MFVCGPWGDATVDPDANLAGAIGKSGCFAGLVLSDAVDDSSVSATIAEAISREQAGKLKRLEQEREELQAALRDRDALLEQTRSQLNVARRELETLQRRWQQQVSEYEQRLNASRIDCERLQRQVDAFTRLSENAEDESRLDETPPASSDSSGGHDENDLQATSEAETRDFRHVFTRLRHRSRQQRVDIARVSEEAFGTTTFIVCDL